MKLNASRAGSRHMTRTVNMYISATGPRGVPKGRVDAKNVGYGRRPWRATSRITRAFPTVFDDITLY